MNRIILLFVSLVFPITALAQEFPSFPMAFWGNVTLNSSPLVSGSSVAVYCGDSLVGQVMLLEDGVYGYEDAIKQKLLVSNCAGKMIFKYILRGTDVPLVGSEELSYSGFVEGAVVQKDMSFVSNRIAPDGETGNVNINNQTPLVVVSDVQLPVNAVIASGTSNPGVDVSSLVDNGVAVLPEINIVSNNASNVNVNIPANTTVNSTGNWDGVIAAPTNTTVTIPGGVPYTAIQIGFSGGKLSFNKAVRILIPGGAGKKVGYIRSGISFTEILTNCVADTQLAGDSLPGDGDCKISVGNDMVLWTKHFTTFATYALTPPPSPVVSGGGGGGGGGGSTSIIPVVPSFQNVSIVINDGDDNTVVNQVVLSLNGGANVKKMLVSNDSKFEGLIQENYVVKKNWILPSGDGKKVICVKFFDVNGLSSNVVCDDIYYQQKSDLKVIASISRKELIRKIIILIIQKRLALIGVR